MIEQARGALYRYSVQYVRDQPGRVIHRTVTARDAEDARLVVKAVDPLFYATVKSPKRGARLTR